MPSVNWTVLRASLKLYVFAAVLAGLATWGIQEIFVVRANKQFQERVNRLADHLTNGSAKMQVMGSMITLGSLDPVVKATADGSLPVDNSNVLDKLARLYSRFNLSNAFVTNSDGLVLAYYILGGKSGTGRDLSYRPYFRAAMSGTPNMYAALGSNTGERGFYIAAPIHDQGTGASVQPMRAIGTVVAKMDFDEVDQLLEAETDPLIVVSPEGVVFASNIEAWRFNIAGDAQAMASAVKDSRVSKAFENLTPQRLPVDAQGWAEVDGQRLQMASATVNWNDPQGHWRLSGFASPTRTYSLISRILTALVIFGFVVLAGYWWQARAHARARTRQVRLLLDNSGQGFLTFGTNLRLGSEFSRACVEMLGQSPAKKIASQVFFPTDPQKAELFETVIAAAQAESDPSARESMLSLLPTDIERGATWLKAEYTALEDGRFMVVLTDISEERRIAAMLEDERRRLELIVLAITDSRNFFDTIDSFKAFLLGGLSGQLASPQSAHAIARELYRQIHTFKGLLNQFCFPTTPKHLHALESQLSTLCAQGEALTLEPLAALLQPGTLQQALEADLAILNQALGEEFLTRGEGVVLTETQAQQLEALAEKLLRGETVDTSVAEIRALLKHISELRRVQFKDVLTGFNGVVQKTAERLHKQVAPLVVHSATEVWIDASAYRPFLRSLVHVFSNAVAHGIETPEARWEQEKDETGHITCTVTADGTRIHLVIADDGAGIALEQLRQRAVGTGLCSVEEAVQLSDDAIAQFIFKDNVSTQHEVNELAGRGVGLAVVLSETQKLGGTLSVKTAADQGTEFLFVLPLSPTVGLAKTGAAALPIAQQLMRSIIARTDAYFSQEFGIQIKDVQQNAAAADTLMLTKSTVIIGLQGIVNQWIAFSLENTLVELVYAQLTADFPVAEYEVETFRDAAIAEMANTILGHCTADLQALDTAALHMTPPVVLASPKSIQRRNNALLHVHRLITDAGFLDIAVAGPGELFDSRLDYLE